MKFLQIFVRHAYVYYTAGNSVINHESFPSHRFFFANDEHFVHRNKVKVSYLKQHRLI